MTHAHHCLKGGIVKALVESTSNAGNNAPLTAARLKNIQRFEVVGPNLDCLRALIAFIQ
ncbi:hypothetical protein SAMN04487958_107205 [Vreelandella subterranea]|uniref:Uncharacterized protein n=1 Tax=Vreelandella subterranea TaxID=416874 RepID=A0A1H9UU54_9GAMM|nr:hypothetical protein SAMN04487958_107205 [Halomonas subterranea]